MILISKATVALLQQMSEEVAQKKLSSSSAEFYKDAADALKKFKDVVGMKNPKDLEEQEVRILNLRRQAEKNNENKDKKIVVEFSDEVKELLE